jgi:tRNA(adenine34) deaminase
MLTKTTKTLAIEAECNPQTKALDMTMMARCVALSRIAVAEGEYPFGSVIALGGQVIAEATNRTVRDGDVTRHAEVIALSRAQKSLGRQQLRKCTLYSNVEPCAMCSFCIRETGIGRVVYAIGSPVMGGLSRWNILRDESMSDRMPQVFSCVPEVVSGVMLYEAEQVWQDWYPFGWQMIKLLGLLGVTRSEYDQIRTRRGYDQSIWRYIRSLFASISDVLRRPQRGPG